MIMMLFNSSSDIYRKFVLIFSEIYDLCNMILNEEDLHSTTDKEPVYSSTQNETTLSNKRNKKENQ